MYTGCINVICNNNYIIMCDTRTITPTSDWSSTEASPQLVLASGQGNGIPGVTEICSPRPGSKKLHVRNLLKFLFHI